MCLMQLHTPILWNLMSSWWFRGGDGLTAVTLHLCMCLGTTTIVLWNPNTIFWGNTSYWEYPWYLLCSVLSTATSSPLFTVLLYTRPSCKRQVISWCSMQLKCWHWFTFSWWCCVWYGVCSGSSGRGKLISFPIYFLSILSWCSLWWSTMCWGCTSKSRISTSS